MDKRENTASAYFGPISRIHSGGSNAHYEYPSAKLRQRRHLPRRGKTVCVPGLNCYSCPAAAGACPIGAFQSVVGSSKFSFSYYVTGTLILLGVLLGRFVCGFCVRLDGCRSCSTRFLAKSSQRKGSNLSRISNTACCCLPWYCCPCWWSTMWGWATRSFASTSVRRVCSRAPFRWRLSMLDPICAGAALYLETFRSHCRGGAERFVLSPLLQMDLPARRILCAHE